MEIATLPFLINQKGKGKSWQRKNVTNFHQSRTALRQNLVDRIHMLHPDELPVQASVEVGKLVRVDAHEV